jgi:hypothetical protein
MEESNDRARNGIDPGDIWPFRAVAKPTTQSAVVSQTRSAMLAPDNMVNHEWERRSGLGQVTILATMSSALADESGEALGHRC